MHKQQRWQQAWEYCQAKLIQILGRASQRVDWSWSQCIKSHHAQMSDVKRSTKPLLNQKQRQKHLNWAKEKKNWTVAQWYKVLFSDESQFCISFGNQGPRVWRKSGEAQNRGCLKSSVKFPQSVMIWADMSSAGVGPLCFLKSTVKAAIYNEILEHLMLPSVDKLYGDADFIFQQDLAPAHTAKGTKKLVQWPWGYCAWLASKLAWPELHRESDLKAAIKATWASITTE